MATVVRLLSRRLIASKATQWRWLTRTMMVVSVLRWLTRRRTRTQVVTLRDDDIMTIDVHRRAGARR